MKQIFSLSILLFCFIYTFSQETNYSLQKDISYYNIEESETDEYKKSRCKLDIYYPTNKSDFPTVVWFHGGALKKGNKQIPESLKEQDIAVVSVNYRLYPKVKSPRYIEDAAAAVAWTLKNIEDFGGNSDLIFVSGHSAGGYLTSMVGLDKRWLKKHELDPDRLAGLIPFSGHTITHMTVREERKIGAKKPIVDDMAPLYHIRNDAPPLLLITGDRELELLGRYEENAYMMRMMKVAGHEETTLYELDGYGHSMTEPAFPLLLKMIKEVSEKNLNQKVQ